MTRRAFSVIAFAAVLCAASAASAQTTTPRLAWDSNTEADLAGYIVYYGLASNSYSGSVDVGRSTQWSMASLTPGRRYYFAVRAYNTSGMLSAPSAELAFDFPTPQEVVPGPRTGLFWRHSASGQLAAWEIEGTVQISGASLTPTAVSDTAWKIVGTGDFNGDRQRDIVWQHDNGTVSAWLMHDNTLVDGQLFQPASVGDPDWRLVTTGDMNRDGRPDLIWRNRRTGVIAAWLMNGLTRVEGLLITPDTVSDTNWEIVGTGDFDGDHNVDLIWRHRTQGYVSVWFMNGLTMREGRSLSPARVIDTGWSIRAINDVNGDSQPDLVWQHTNGQIATWIMNRDTMRQGVAFTPDRVPDVNWLIVGAR